MTIKPIWICGGQLVLPERTVRGDILVEHGRIASIYTERPMKQPTACEQVLDASGMYVLPGLIDIHSDAIEKELQPRPKTFFPFPMSFFELQKKLAGHGITTMYHSLSLADGVGIRNNNLVKEIVSNIKEHQARQSIIRNRVHLRYEVSNLTGIPMVKDLVHSGIVDLLSYMDHTPGQGQFKAVGTFEDYIIKTYGMSDMEAATMADDMLSWKNGIDWTDLKSIACEAKAKGISIASHDDDCCEKIDFIKEYATTISEFPINLQTALYARQQHLHVAVGAPNIILGKSHSNNMRALDAILSGAANILCSDYLPSSLHQAVFKLQEEGVDLAEAVCMASLNPALALGIEKEFGSIEEGKWADAVVVEVIDNCPVVRKTLVGGKLVYETNFR